MFPKSCNAMLMSDDDVLLEYGKAIISIKNKSIDFMNSFVPLIKIGTPVKIICTINGQRTHIFFGEVYLSSKNLLRMVNIKCKILPDSEKVLTISTKINAKICNIDVKHKFRTSIIKKWFECIICSLSTYSLSFKSKQLDIDLLSPIMLKVGFPLFIDENEIIIKPKKNSMLFGNSALYDCQILSIDEYAIMQLIEYIRDKNIELLSDILI